MPSNNDPTEPAVIRPGRIIRNIVWMTGSGFISRLIAFAVSVFLARVVGAAGLGILGSALAFVSFFQSAVNAGLGPYAVRDAAQDPERIPELYARVIGTRLMLAGAASLLILLSLLVLPDRLNQHANIIVVYGLLLFAEALMTQWAIRGLERMKLIAAGLVGQHLVMAAGVFLLLPGREESLWIVPASHATSLFLMQGWFYLRLHARFTPLRPAFRLREATKILRDSLPVASAMILRLFYHHGDVLLLALLASEASAGEFFASQRIILVGVMVGAIYQANAYPTTSRIGAHDPSAAARFQSNILRYAMIALMPGIVIGTWYAEPIIVLVFGDQFPTTPEILFVMLFSVPLFVFNLGMQNLLLAVKQGRLPLVGVAIAVISHVLLAVMLIPGNGGVGAAWACLTGEVLCALYFFVVVLRKFGTAPLQYRMLSALAGGGAMATVLSASASLGLYAQIALGLAGYVASALLLGALRRDELTYVVERVRKTLSKRGQPRAQ